MDLFLEQIEEAKKALRIADHLAYVTFPLIGDEKITNMITNNLQISAIKSLEALLNYEKYYKRISNIPETFDDKFDIFKMEVSKRYNIGSEIIFTIKEINDISSKKDLNLNFDFFQDNYKFKKLGLKKIKEYINIVKLLVNKIDFIIGKNARRL